MRDQAWDRMVQPVDETGVAEALDRVRVRAAERRGRAARRWRLGGLAAALVVTFGAGLAVGRATASRHELGRIWSVGGQSLAAERGTFVVVPAMAGR